jgi:hypothetical protein
MFQGSSWAMRLIGLIGDATNHFAQVGFGIDAVELCGLDERINCGCAFAAGVGSLPPGELPTNPVRTIKQPSYGVMLLSSFSF